MTDKHSTISQYVSIVQRIERELPELKMRVRFPLGAQKNSLPQGRLFLLAEWTGLTTRGSAVRARTSPRLSRPVLFNTNKNNPTQVGLFLSAEWTGLEPATFCVTGRRSNQLSYHSKVLKNGHFHSATGKS